ncbi:putative transferase [Nocardia nova SH22a]|uniref:Putative transferase n=1 Tax=Nocardia nova SH22a TaxID=1415166 RepID=W5TQX3_9NOCA|nr:acyltransferase [Nocardia nova]AHH21529.1 putative transferase [Nocardia nova SH22a]
MAPLPLSAVDHMWTANMAGPLQFVVEFDAELDAERLVAAYIETAREFAGADAALVQLDEHTLAMDVDDPRPEIRATTGDPDAPLSECVDPVRIGRGHVLARGRVVRRGDRTAIGLSMSHGLADGYGLFFFLAAWAARSRGARFLSPRCDRTVLTRPQARERDRVDPEALRRAGFVTVAPDAVLPELEVRTGALDLTEFEAQAQDSGLSTANLLAASLFRDYAAIADTERITLACPVDIRRHVRELGPTYFGNGFLQVLLEVETGWVRESTVAEIAGRVRAEIDTVPGRIDDAVAEIETFLRVRGLAALDRVWGYPPDSGFLVSDVSRIPASWLDFGAGPPVAQVTPARRPRQHGCYLLPDPERAHGLHWASTLDHEPVRQS